MCNQAVSLVAAELERQGIATVVLQLLREAAEHGRPPRALFVPFLHGYPLGKPDESRQQRGVIEGALRRLEDAALEPPGLVDRAERGGECSG